MTWQLWRQHWEVLPPEAGNIPTFPPQSFNPTRQRMASPKRDLYEWFRIQCLHFFSYYNKVILGHSSRHGLSANTRQFATWLPQSGSWAMNNYVLLSSMFSIDTAQHYTLKWYNRSRWVLTHQWIRFRESPEACQRPISQIIDLITSIQALITTDVGFSVLILCSCLH